MLRTRRVYTKGMTSYNLFKLVLATTAVLPLSVNAASLTADQAKMATASAIEAAAGNGERIANVPVEFAWALMIVPYGGEMGDASPAKTNPSKADVEQTVAARQEYWKSVSAALAGEKARLTESMQNPETPASVLLGNSLRTTKILRFSIAVDAIVADCGKDASLVKSIGMQETETRQGFLDRKARLFKSLNSMKTTADGESTHLGFYRAAAEAVDVLHILPD